LVKFLAVVGCRKGEAVTLRHGDLPNGVWMQGDNKSSRPTQLPLPPLALNLIGQGGARDLVFPGEGGVLAGFSKFKRVLDEASGVSGWRLHDLRRTFASGLQDLRVDQLVIGACLNHAIPGVTGVYLRSNLMDQKCEALARWADRIEAITRRKEALA
jgi:integrase